MKLAPVLAGLTAGVILGCGAGYAFAHRLKAAAPARAPDAASATDKQDPNGVSTATSSSAKISSSIVPAPMNTRSFTEQLRDIVAIKSDVRGAYEAELLFSTLSLADLPAAFTAVQALPPGESRSRIIGTLFERWGSLDGFAALAATAQLGAREKLYAESTALEGWAKTNPEAAWNAARDMIAENPMWSWRARGAMREFSRVDLSRAMTQAAAVTSENARQALRSAIIDAAAEDGQLDSVMREGLQFAGPASREAWIKDVFRVWGSKESDAPLAALRSITDSALAQQAMTGFMSGWSELDPHGAFEYALENRGDPLVSRSLASVINTAVQYNSEADVRAMVAKVVEQGALSAVVNEVGMSIAQNYPTLSLELAGSLADENQRNRQTSMTLSMWALNDLKSAAAYFEAMPNTSVKVSAFSSISYQSLRQTDGPATVARWINDFSGQDRIRAVQSLIGNQSNQPAPLQPEAKAALAQAIAATPGLPPDALERAKKLFGPAPAP